MSYTQYLLEWAPVFRVKIWGSRRREAGRSGLAGQWSGRQAEYGGYAGLPSVEHLSAFDIILPTATWYEKDDMNTSDMHPFAHPLSAAVDPAWEAKSDWEIYKAIAKKFSEVCVGHLGKETDIVTLPIQHDSAAELAQPLDVKDWKKGECDLIPGKTAPRAVVVERDYPATYERFTSIGPLMEKIGNGGKGIAWNTQSEMDLLRKLNYTKAEGPAKGQPMLNTAIDAAEMILTLAPETNRLGRRESLGCPQRPQT